MQRRPGKTLQELAARIHQDVATCDFPSIEDPQDEALRQGFICSVNNEAVLKALFKVKDTDLTFARAVQVAIETEDVARVAKETVYSSKARPVNKVHQKQKKGPQQNHQQSHSKDQQKCYRCGKVHKASDCPYKETKCHFCDKKGHLQAFFQKKQRQEQGRSSHNPVKRITKAELVKAIFGEVSQDTPRLDVPVTIQDHQFTMELDTATTGNFVSLPVWKQLGKPKLDDVRHRYESASKHNLPVLGTFMAETKDPVTGKQSSNPYIVTKIPDLNLLGRKDSGDFCRQCFRTEKHRESSQEEGCRSWTSCNLRQALCFPSTRLSETVWWIPWSIQAGIGMSQRLWIRSEVQSWWGTGFSQGTTGPICSSWWPGERLRRRHRQRCLEASPVQRIRNMPVVPIRKAHTSGSLKPKLRICGDYSMGINDQLEDHRHPLPLPEELMQKLGGGFGYTKIDLADAYNQIQLAPESQRRLALSTHRGVSLQQGLPFGIKSAPGYFQEIMENLTSDLPGVAIFQDNMLVSGQDANNHLSNLKRLLTHLNDKGLRCRHDECQFAQPSVEYLGHTLSAEGISKGSKVEAVLKMPPPTDISSLKSFLGSVQFYWKFIPNLASMAEPLYRLTKKATPWKWEDEEQATFEQLKNVLSSDQILVHFDPNKTLVLACDASNLGIGAVLVHHYPDGSESSIANMSKTLTAAERNYSQIH